MIAFATGVVIGALLTACLIVFGAVRAYKRLL